MLRRSINPRLAPCGVLLAAGCACLPPGTHTALDRDLGLPADVAAAIAAGAVRCALPFADPVPQAAGAPVLLAADGSYRIVYEQGPGGDWVPQASHRLSVVPDRSPAGALVVRHEVLPGPLALPGWGRRATARLEVHVRRVADRSHLAARLPAAVATTAAAALERAFELAVDPAAPQIGLAEPNLAGVAAQSAIDDARRRLAAGEPCRAEAALLAAARLTTLGPLQQRQLGELARLAGNLDLARARLEEALLRSGDAATRADLLARLTSLSAVARTSGRDANGSAGLAAAAALLHTARRQRPVPALDYSLASQLHRRGADELAAFACSLLAREHGAAILVAAPSAPAPPR
ncbi:MAG: hypothetical protein KF830_16935 [Planctomycetes bacterium]|nr:hypothetical protein [Planctomycetota bacterium]